MEEEDARAASPANASESNQSDLEKDCGEAVSAHGEVPTKEREDSVGSKEGTQGEAPCRGGHRRAVLLDSDDDSD